MKRLYYGLFFLAFNLFLIIHSQAQVSLPIINSSYVQDFNSLPESGTTNDISTLPTGWVFSESGTNANTTYAAGTGSSNAGNTYSFGLAADRALGGLQSGSLIPTIGVNFINGTGTIINSLDVTYWGEQWRLGATARAADRLDFQYSVDASSLASGTWTDVDALDFSSPLTTGVAGALIGNDNHTQITFTITGLNIASGSSFFLRWQDFNVASSDDGLAIDDFSITPIGVPANLPSITLTPSSLNFNDVTVNTIDTLSYKVVGSNLTDSISVSSANPLYTLSLDAVNFYSSVSLPDSGGVVQVRFAPLTDGIANSIITHTSGSVTKTLSLSGDGFDQVSHILPIATARLQPVGTKVTIAGRVTVGLELGNPASVQDGTGGIPVFDFALAHSVEIGDSVIVTGPIGVFSNQKQISGSGIIFSKPDSTKRFIAPKPIALTELAANEGLLVTVQNVELVNKGFVFYPQSTEKITDGSNQADLRIDGDTNIPGLTKPQGIVNITGVVGRFNTNAQLLPRFQLDVPGSQLPTTPVDSISKSKTLDVVNWNFEFFGARKEDYKNEEYGPEDEELQLQNIKTVLNTLKADIIAVEEVSNDSTFARLVSQLSGYSYSCSDRYSYSFDGPDDTFPPQKVCFIYDTTTVNVLSARAMFESRYDSARTIDPSLLPGIPGGPQSFFSSGRLPYLLTADVTIEGVTERISLAVLHSKSGATESDRMRRLYDGSVLKDSLDTHYPNEKFIVLGDLNDDLDQSIVTGAVTPYANYVGDTSRYIPITKTLSDAGARSTISFSDMIDHQILSNELKENYLEGSAQVITPFSFIANYAATTSDHLPVISRYTFQAPQIAFVNTSVTLTEDSTTYTVKLKLSKALSQPKQINIAVGGTATNGSDYTIAPAISNGVVVLDLPVGALDASFTFTVINDALDELTESATFTLQSSPGIEIAASSLFTLTLEDNDVPQVSFAELIARGEEGSGAYEVKLKLSTPPVTDQTVTIQVLNGFGVTYPDDYITEPVVSGNKIQVTIPAGSSSAHFTLTPVADNRRELPLEAITFYLSHVSSGLQLRDPRLSLFAIVDVNKRHPHFVVYPNPTRGPIRLSGGDLEPGEIIQANLRNGNGESIYTGSGTLENISEAISEKLRHERTGIYALSIIVEGETIVIRVLKI